MSAPDPRPISPRPSPLSPASVKRRFRPCLSPVRSKRPPFSQDGRHCRARDPAERESERGSPGGKLDIGATSRQGDLASNWQGGKTPVGWVPGSGTTNGVGSGSGPGSGTPEPSKHASEGPGTRPAPAPPAPKTVSVRVCDVSGMIAGEHCRRTRVETYVEGTQPTKVCDKCEAEFKSRLADRANPALIHDTRPSIPLSVEEGLSVSVAVEYTVTADGDVTGVEVVKSSGNRAIDKAVCSAAARRKFANPPFRMGYPAA